MIGLAASDLGAVQTAAALDLDALCAELHSSCNSGLHSSSEGYSVFKIQSDLLSNQLSVEVGRLNLEDVEVNGLADHLFDLNS